MSKKVLVVGSFIVDIATYTPRFPVNGESVIGSSVKFGPGGKGSNQAVAAKRAGADVTMITKVGKDFLSRILYDFYKEEGIGLDYVFESDTAETGSAVIEINEATGENRIIVITGANSEITGEEVLSAEKEFAASDIILTQLESSDISVIEAKRLAKKYNKPIIINTAPMRAVPDDFFEGVDYITPNETEAEFFSGVHVETIDDAKLAAKKLLEKGVKNVIITLGKNGAFYTNGTMEYHVPALLVKPVDTTGAGDSFNGGFAVGIAEGMDVLSAMRFANCLASLKVTRKGTSKAMPTRAEIDELYKKNFKN